MKNELLMYEWLIKEAAPKKPKLLSKSVTKLDEKEKLLLAQLAELSLDVDKNFDDLGEKYETYVRRDNLGLTG
jgi:hypothetical protein